MEQQPEFWMNYYERAWSARGDFLLDLLEKNPHLDAFAAIRMLNRQERRKVLRLSDENPQGWFWQPKEYKDRKDLLPTGVSVEQKGTFLESFYLKPTYISPSDFILDFLETSSEKYDAVVELGAGFAQNIFEIHSLGGPVLPYYAGEISEAGRTLAKSIAQRASNLDLTIFHWDHKHPDLSPVKEKGRVLFFTAHSLEQVPEVPGRFFEVISKHAENVTCIHMEPFGYQFQTETLPAGKISEVQNKYFANKGWNRNLFDIASHLHQIGKIEITHLAKNFMDLDFASPTSLMIWRSVK